MEATERRLIEHLLTSIVSFCKNPNFMEAKDKPQAFRGGSMRQAFVTTNGVKLSIQQGASHYSKDAWHFELGYVPHHELLEPYGYYDDEQGRWGDVYGQVPFDVVVRYIDAIEKGERGV